MNILEIAGNKTSNDILSDAKLDWTVELSSHLEAPCPSAVGFTSDKRATVRTDNGRVLGVVGSNYQIVQNSELVYMAEEITKKHNSTLTVTTGGELKGGERVWLSIKAPSFDVAGNDDEVQPYLLFSNGHDGLHTLSSTPTSIRVICENTLNMALREGRKAKSCISLRHKGNMASKIEGLMDVVSEFYQRSFEFSEHANYLARVNLNSNQVWDYFDKAYSTVVKFVPSVASTEADERAINKKRSTILKWKNVFDSEETSLGSNMWTAFNAVTNWIDHGVTFRGPHKAENKFSSLFFGSSSEQKQELFSATLNGDIIHV